MDPIVHFEIPTDDMARSEKFYQTVFGWKTQNWQDKYTMVETCEKNEETHMPKEPGKINGGMLMRNVITPTPILTIQVDSIDDALAKVEAEGGSTVQGKMPIDTMGWTAYFKDSEGNILGLFEYAKK